MRKKILLLLALLVMTTVSYSAEKQSLEASLNSIENKFNDLLEKEAQKKREFEAQKAQLENEVADLKAKEEGKEKLFEKLKKDSEVRWYRDKYKQVLNNYDTYYKNLAKLIKEKEQKIAELEQILAIMGNQSSKILKDITKYFYSFCLILLAAVIGQVSMAEKTGSNIEKIIKVSKRKNRIQAFNKGKSAIIESTKN